MAVSLLSRELECWDPMFFGFTPRGCAMGVDLSCGLGGYVNRAGLHLLYRGVGTAAAIDYTNPVGCTLGEAVEPGVIRNYAGYPFAPSSVYYLAVRAVSPGGIEEQAGTVAVRIETDGGGVPIDPVPNPPIRLIAAPKAGGKILLTWDYDPAGEGASPASWKIYHDNGTGSMIGTALASTTRRIYLAGPYAGGLLIQFKVRAVARGGAEEGNDTIVSQTAETDGPPDLAEPTISEGPEL